MSITKRNIQPTEHREESVGIVERAILNVRSIARVRNTVNQFNVHALNIETNQKVRAIQDVLTATIQMEVYAISEKIKTLDSTDHADIMKMLILGYVGR